MKLPKIIAKNLRILIRSKSSALIVILGPLLLILLVGLAFSSSSTFTLNIGVFSPDESSLTESYIGKLSNENYRITTFASENECIENIKSSGVHTCIIFPPNFEISDNKTQDIKFYIDQTKQNFVYAVINTLTSSFGARSTELSLDLTNQIVDVVSRTQNTVTKSKEKELSSAIELGEDVLSASKELQDKLDLNMVDTEGVSDVSGTIDKEAKVLRNRITDLYTEGENLLNLSYIIYNDAVNFDDENQTYEDDLDDYGSSKGSLYQAWNDSIASKDKFVNATVTLTASVTDLIDEVEDSAEVQREIIAGLKNGIDVDMGELQGELEDLDESMGGILDDIRTINVFSAESIVSPITTSVETIVPEKTHLDYLFPSLIVLLIMFMSILLSSTLVLMEKTSKAYFRNFITPTNDFVFILSTFLTSIILLIVQIMVVFLIAGFIFDTPLLNNLLNISILVFLISSVFILLGMAVGYLFNTEQTAMMGSISIGSIILLTSDLILPIENMPLYIQKIAKFNPFVVGSEALKKSMLFSSTLSQIQQELYFFGILIVVISVFIILIQQITKIHFMNKFSRAKAAAAAKGPKNIKDIFQIDNHLIGDEKELYRFIKRLPRKEYKRLIYKKTNKIADFTENILKDAELAKKLSKLRTRWIILKVIEKHTRFKTQSPPPQIQKPLVTTTKPEAKDEPKTEEKGVEPKTEAKEAVKPKEQEKKEVKKETSQKPKAEQPKK